jgi:hypothetical protein
MMTDAQYWSIANALPKRVLNGIYVVDWRTKIPGCDPTLQQACEFVLGFNPLSGCWIDPGAQYVARPSPYPSPSSWGVSLCNAPITQPPPSGGTYTPPGGTIAPSYASYKVLLQGQLDSWTCDQFRLNSTRLISGWQNTINSTEYGFTSAQKTDLLSMVNAKVSSCGTSGGQQQQETSPTWPGINSTFVLVAIAGVALLFFMRK